MILVNVLIKMDKFRLFISNLLIYGLGGVISKIIPFVMLPVITRLVPDPTYLGLNDLVVTFVDIGSAIAIFGMYDAVFRLFFDEDSVEYKKCVCSSALAFTVTVSIILCLILLKFDCFFSNVIFNNTYQKVLIYISAMTIFFNSVGRIFSIPTRAQNNRKVYIFLNLVSSLLAYGMAVPLLLKGYYIIAIPLAGLIAVLTSFFVFFLLNRDWFVLNAIDYRKILEMLKIAIPLLPVIIIYWIYSSCDRLLISKLLGEEKLGVYSIGAKVASVSQLIYVAFAGGWQYFAFSTMKDEQQVENNSKVYEYLGIISFIALAFVCALCKTFFETVFTGSYVQGYRVMPMLFLGPLLLMLYQVAGNQFLVIKKTWPSIFILLSGAVFNVLFNVNYVTSLGIEGAALANVGGYLVTNVICCIVLLKMKLLMIKLRFVLMAILSFCVMGIWMLYTYDSILQGLVIAFLYLAISIYLYRCDLMSLYRMAFKKG